MDQTTLQAVDYMAAIGSVPLSQAAMHACKRRLLDSIACAFGAMDAPLCRRLRILARRYAGEPSAAVWGSAERTTPEMAAFVNGVAIRYLDCSDTYVSRSPGHPSDVIAGILAIAETQGASGAAALAAIALGYDLYCSFLDAATSHAQGIDQATAAVLGAAAGAGVLLGLPPAAVAHALSIGIASNVHLNCVRHGELSDWKGCAGPDGSRAGVFAAILAQAGVTGPSDAFDGPGGLWSFLSPVGWSLPKAGPRKVEQSDIKTFPVCYHGLAAVEAALALRAQVDLASLDRIEIETYTLAVTRMANDATRWAPATRETADHSLPFTVASALQHGALTPASYAPARLDDPALRVLMRKVQVQATEEMDAAYPDAAPARLTAVLHSGERRVAELRFPKGHARNPVSDAELEEKLRDLAGHRLGTDRVRRLADTIWSLDTLPDISAFLCLLGDS